MSTPIAKKSPIIMETKNTEAAQSTVSSVWPGMILGEVLGYGAHGLVYALASCESVCIKFILDPLTTRSKCIEIENQRRMEPVAPAVLDSIIVLNKWNLINPLEPYREASFVGLLLMEKLTPFTPRVKGDIQKFALDQSRLLRELASLSRDNNIVHDDVHQTNHFMYNSEGKLKLIDWGRTTPYHDEESLEHYIYDSTPEELDSVASHPTIPVFSLILRTLGLPA